MKTHPFPLFFALLLIALPFTTICQTNVSGTISTNTTWTKANSPYVVQGSVTVAAGVALTIEADVVVKHSGFDWYDMILVHGTIDATGTSTEPIVFTDITDDDYGGDTNNDGSATTPHREDWRGIYIYPAGTGTFSECIFRYGGDWGTGAAALAVGGAGTTVQNNTFEECGKAVTVFGNTSPNITGNTFNNNSYPLGFSLESSPTLSGNTLANNDRNGIWIEPFNYSGGSFTLEKTDFAGITNITYITNSLTVEADATLTIEPGVVIKHSGYDWYDLMDIKGTIVAEGTAMEPIVFTDITDDDHGGDTNNDGSATTPHREDWRSVYLWAGSTATFSSCLFRYGGDQATGIAALSVRSAGAVVEDNTFEQCGKGLTIVGAISPSITDNTFTENIYPIAVSLEPSPVFSGNTLSNNDHNGIWLEPFDYSGGSYTLEKTDVAGVQDISYITSSLTIEADATLTIEPGVVVKHTGWDWNDIMDIKGTLNAVGTVAEPIVFTDIADDGHGGDTNNDGSATAPHREDWRGVYLWSGSTAAFSNCLFRYGGYGGTGVAALAVRSAGAVVQDNTFEQCGKGLTIVGAISPSITDNTFTENIYPIAVSLEPSPVFSGNTLSNNDHNGIWLEPFDYSGGSYTLEKTDVAGVQDISYITSSLTIEADATLTIEPGVVVKHTGWDWNDIMDIKGTLNAVGTVAEPIVFTDIADDGHGGDTNNDGSATAPHREDWRGVYLWSGSTAAFSNCLFRYGGYGGTGVAALAVRSAGAVVQDNTFEQCGKGLTIVGAISPSITDNTFTENIYPIAVSLEPSPVFSGNTLSNNDHNGIWLEPFDYSGGSYTLEKTDVAGVQDISYITSSLTIEADATLTIEPGVVVKHTGWDWNDIMDIKGTLNAVGTVAEPIVFTDIADDGHGGDTNNDGSATAPHREDWRGVYLWSGSTAAFSNCLFRYGGYGGTGVAALAVRSAGAVVQDNTFEQCGKGLTVVGAIPPSITDNTFTENIYPIAVSLEPSPVFSGNTLSNNDHNGIWLEPFDYSGGSYTLEKTDVAGVQDISYITSSLTIEADATLTIEPGVVVKHTGWDWNDIMDIKGTLNAVGTVAEPIVFTDIADDGHGGDTNNDGSATAPHREDWRGVYLWSGSTAAFSNCYFRYGGYSSTSSLYTATNISIEKCQFYKNGIGMRVVNGGSADLDSCRFEANKTGLQKDGGTVTIHNSNLYDNTTLAINNLTTDTLDATANWWGDPTGPEHTINNPTGQGDEVSDYVKFDPWLPQLVLDTIPPAEKDLAVVSITTPKSGCALGAAETIEVKIANLGTQAQSNFQVGFVSNGVLVAEETIIAAISPGEIINHVFSVPIDLSSFGIYLAGSYTVLAGDEKPHNDTLSASINNLPLLTTAIAAPSSICLGNEATLTANNGTNYTWSSGHNTATIEVGPTVTTTYTVTVTNAIGCSVVDSMMVEVLPLPDTAMITISGASAFCEGDSVQLVSSINENIVWSTGAATPSI